MLQVVGDLSGVVWLGTHMGHSQAQLEGIKARVLRASAPTEPHLYKARKNGAATRAWAVIPVAAVTFAPA